MPTGSNFEMMYNFTIINTIVDVTLKSIDKILEESYIKFTKVYSVESFLTFLFLTGKPS